MSLNLALLSSPASVLSVEDYRGTACTSLLKYIVEREQFVQGGGMNHSIQALHGITISHMTVYFLKVVNKDRCDFVSPHSDQRRCSKRQSRPMVLSEMIDIDISLKTAQTLTKEDWAQFIDSYYLVVQ